MDRQFENICSHVERKLCAQSLGNPWTPACLHLPHARITELYVITLVGPLLQVVSWIFVPDAAKTVARIETSEAKDPCCQQLRTVMLVRPVTLTGLL